MPKELADRAEYAAIEVGYSPKSARAIGRRLLRRPDVQARLRYLAEHPEALNQALMRTSNQVEREYLKDGKQAAIMAEATLVLLARWNPPQP